MTKDEFLNLFEETEIEKKQLTYTEFEELLRKSIFKSKVEFTKSLGLVQNVVTDWKKRNICPIYVKPALKWSKLSKLCDEFKNRADKEEIIKFLENNLNDEKLKSLETQNEELQKKIDGFKELKDVFYKFIEKKKPSPLT